MFGKVSKTHYREFTFDQVLGEWSKDHISTELPANVDGSGKRNVTVVLDTALKYNVALSLAYPESVVHRGDCCEKCATTTCNSEGRLPQSIIRTVVKFGRRMVKSC